MIQHSFSSLPTDRRVNFSVEMEHSIKQNPRKRHEIIEVNVNAGFYIMAGHGAVT
jgi:hypothetical protein